MSFQDKLRILLSLSADQVVMIWDFEKQIIRSIEFRLPTVEALFHGDVDGDILVAQNSKV
jgi:hypothetical protein